ncbi:MAG TPA: flagellum-specific ATP synthase FliI [Verrucomicrobiales bacterium]|nr:flagellum-specific ATP synthase FliI [Verrucomicrobiales bacterium]|tara:strand:- start:3877 stop:5340 length:1464 start_codon:yes stop_codon:yes gene_type:complete
MIADGKVKKRGTSASLAKVRARLSGKRLVENRGRVTQMIGLVIESQGPMAAVGEICQIESQVTGQSTEAEVVGFRDRKLLLMPLGEVQGICPGSEVIATGHCLRVPVGEKLLGRVINGLGQPLDDLGSIPQQSIAELNLTSPHPLRRERITEPFETGVKAIDTFTPVGRGQRMGIFAGSGVGKSTLMGMMASQAEADVNVIALIGERGREVREFIERDLDEEGRKKSVIVVATSNEPALARVKGAFLSMTIAEYFRSQGKNVLLMMDSVTRFAMAQREIGLAIGEPPSSRGYTPSVFSLLPQLLERAGNNEHGSITGLFNVLVEGDDINDPVADAVRSILDGHLVLSRELAALNHYPAIDVLESVSRLSHDLLNHEQREFMGDAREMLAIHRKSRDLISIGAYQAGSNPQIDRSIALHDSLNEFLRQNMDKGCSIEQSWQELEETLKANEFYQNPQQSPQPSSFGTMDASHQPEGMNGSPPQTSQMT